MTSSQCLPKLPKTPDEKPERFRTLAQELGLVESLARPGGNVTGLSLMAIDLSGKRLESLKEAVPSLLRVALLVDFSTPKTNDQAAPDGGPSAWKAMVQMNVLAFDIAEIVERFHQHTQINFFFLGTARVPEHANNWNFVR
jgi:hypothetical protein